MVTFGKLWGIDGILYAGPFADGLAFLIASTLLILEVKHLRNNENKETVTVEEKSEVENQNGRNIVITIAREYGSGGRYIGKLVAEKLGIKLYDKEFVKKVAEETGLSEEFIKNNEQKRDALADLNNGYYFGLNNADELFLKESEIIKNTAEKESCVIVGRCADFILNDRKNVTKVFIYSNMENKVKRATEFYGLDKAKAEKEITRINKLRANHYKHYTEKEWNNPNNYDICINSDTLGVEKSADLICEIVNKKTDQLV